MKKYSIAFFLYIAILCLAYVGSYRLTYENSRKKTEQIEELHVETAKTEESVIRPDTEYITEVYNRKTNETQEVRSKLPLELIGLDRKEAEAYAHDHTKDPDLEELEKGFESMVLKEFSDEEVVFQKTYMPWEKEYKYSLGIVNGYVVVYYLDHKTVYEYTDISISALTKELMSQMRLRKCRMDIHELYEFLENYSS